MCVYQVKLILCMYAHVFACEPRLSVFCLYLSVFVCICLCFVGRSDFAACVLQIEVCVASRFFKQIKQFEIIMQYCDMRT